MRFCIYTGNHGNGQGISDIARLLRLAILDCGYDVVISHVLMRDHCNILVENFTKIRQLDQLQANNSPGTKFVVIAPEVLTGASFNAGIVKGHEHYSDVDYWRARYQGFLIAAGMSEAIWVLGESSVDSYVAAFPDKAVRFLPHGYVNNFAMVEHRSEKDKDIDFYFSGSLTEHRLAILMELTRHHIVAFNEQSSPDQLRADLMARSKVCLSLRLSPENEVPSVSRMHFHLQNRNYLVHEQYAKPCMLDPYVLHSPSESIVEWARAALLVSNRREVADAALATFSSEVPLSRWMRPLLIEAVGDCGPPRPAPKREASNAVLPRSDVRDATSIMSASHTVHHSRVTSSTSTMSI
jgi:hypothetical protein